MSRVQAVGEGPTTRGVMSLGVLIARLRLALIVFGFVVLVAGGIVGVPLLACVAVAGVCGAVAVSAAGRTSRSQIGLHPPTPSHWVAHNSPSDKVPSHGTHLYGQTYAIDLADPHDVADTPRWWPPTRDPHEFESFGRPVTAAVDGVVVSVRDRRRDHRSRDSWPGAAWFLLEGVFRSVGGARWLLGNHVVICIDDTTFVATAHLQQRSIQVDVGEHVKAGQVIGACGNSGNSTQPHVHVQCMDHRNANVAAGVPIGLLDDDVPRPLPRNGDAVGGHVVT